MIANPIVGWPDVSERVSQLYPLTNYGLFNIPVNIFRYVGWFGDQGVQLFIIVSGFGLTWGLLNRQSGLPLNIKDFYLGRAGRIFPLWWGSHILFSLTWLFTGWGLSMLEPATYISMLGIRVTPGLLYYFSPAWWYIWLIIQLFLIYPLLWDALRRFGALRLLFWSSVIAFAIRGVGLYVFDGYLDAWSRGAIFITRLPEFVFGISLAAWLYHEPVKVEQQLHKPVSWVLAAAVYALGLGLSLTLPGMIFAPALLGASAFVLLYLLFDRLVPLLPGWLLSPSLWVGKHTYSLYLVHHPVILVLISSGMLLSPSTLARILASIVLTVILALLLEWFVDRVLVIIRRLGIQKSLWVAVGAIAFVILTAVGGEVLVRWIDPQEILGWGERPALEMDPVFGWHLIPSSKTHLRWSSYDYVVQSNSLGFPGPEYPVEKHDDAYRIMVAGDAFSSAEGVDTSQAWPRLLEAELADDVENIDVEVLNFAITGYGPDQSAAVVSHYAPIYKPDLIIFQTFVNDFQDVLWTNEDFQSSIGFQLTDQDGAYSILRLEHLRKWVRLNILEKFKERLRGDPNMEGYFLGNFYALERSHPDIDDQSRGLVYQDIAQIKNIADQVGAEVLLFMVPAPVQICSADNLDYYPSNIDLGDQSIFDIDKPQRVMARIAAGLNLEFYDVRAILQSTDRCIYQPQNMHWTESGHQVFSQYIADVIASDGYLP